MSNHIVNDSTSYHCNKFLLSSKPNADYVLILLNSSDNYHDYKLLQQLWSRCKYRIAADGAANCLYDLVPLNQRDSYILDHIVGDLDSIRSEVEEYYKSKGSIITKVIDQDNNDLDKAIEQCKIISYHNNISLSS